MRVTLLVGVLALSGCASILHQSERRDAYRELVQLRGETLTLLRNGQLGVGEAVWLDSGLNTARADLDRGDTKDAQTLLDADHAYLASRGR